MMMGRAYAHDMQCHHSSDDEAGMNSDQPINASVVKQLAIDNILFLKEPVKSFTVCHIK